MRYSVYDYRSGKFDYYDGVGDAPATGRFRTPTGTPTMPEVIAARVPPGATHVGRGDAPQGTIATTDAKIGALEAEGKQTIPSWFVLTTGVLLGAWAVRRFL